MNLTIKAVVFLIVFGLLLHSLLNHFSLYPDQKIFGPTYISKNQNFISINQITENHIDAKSADPVITLIVAAPEKSDKNNSRAGSLIDNLSMRPQKAGLKSCRMKPFGLVGPIKVWFDGPSIEKMERLYSYLEPGGHGKPVDCLAQHRVAVIIPFRDRDEHLRILLHNLHNLLTKQQLDYAIFVIDQKRNETFNRAKLMNVGFVEAKKLYDWQCFIFHDVDLLPEDDRNIYSCPEQPRHMSVAIDKFKYKLPYGSIFGGISALTKHQFESINGFSNDYWGWGGEDDDLSMRVESAGYKIMRYPSNIARYKMIKHNGEKDNPINPCRYDLMMKTKERKETDGISSLKYSKMYIRLEKLYTHIKVELLEESSRNLLRSQGFKNC